MKNANKHVLLISNSTLYGTGYLDHAAAEICELLGSAKSMLFVAYALYDREAKASSHCDRLVA